MTVKYKTVITKAGAEKLAAATVPNGKKVNFTAMAVGDGGGALPVPDASQTKLVKEVWRHALNKISQDKKNKNYVVAELLIPPEAGGFWMREMGLYDDAGTLIAVGNMAESYKPTLVEGSGRAQTLRMVIMVSDIASVELTIDTSTVMATQDYVDGKLAEHEQSRRHPDATLAAKGFTQLSSAIDSASEVLAATPKAVKAAYDLANGKYTAADATTARKGIVQLSSATDSVSEVLAATPKAVKTAYDLANAKYTAVDATTASKRENYVKRCVGLPGDTLQIVDGQVMIDGKAIENPENLQFNYFVQTTGPYIPEDMLRELGISKDDTMLIEDSGWESGLLEMGLDSRNAQGKLNPVYHFPLTKKMYETLLGNKKLISKIVMEPEDYAGQMYPLNLYTKWNRNNYGPIWIPAKGATITLTEDNLPIYERCIVAYEGNKLEVKPDGIYINGEKTNEYTFKMDYYWMMGDNRHNSADSRYWGFVPEDHVVGKPIVVWLSLDKDRGWFDGKIRWNRLFKWVD